MIRDIGTLVAVTVAVVTMMDRGITSPGVAAGVLVLAPVVLGIGRSHAGCLSQIVRTVSVLVILPALALLDIESLGMPDVGSALLPVAALLALLLAIYMIMGGRTRRHLWKFVGMVPLLIGVFLLTVTAGVPPYLVNAFLLAIVGLHLFSQSRLARMQGGRGVEESAGAAFEVGGAGLGLFAMAFVSSGVMAGTLDLSLLVLVVALTALETSLYFLFRRRSLRMEKASIG